MPKLANSDNKFKGWRIPLRYPDGQFGQFHLHAVSWWPIWSVPQMMSQCSTWQNLTTTTCWPPWRVPLWHLNGQLGIFSFQWWLGQFLIQHLNFELHKVSQQYLLEKFAQWHHPDDHDELWLWHLVGQLSQHPQQCLTGKLGKFLYYFAKWSMILMSDFANSWSSWTRCYLEWRRLSLGYFFELSFIIYILLIFPVHLCLTWPIPPAISDWKISIIMFSLANNLKPWWTW